MYVVLLVNGCQSMVYDFWCMKLILRLKLITFASEGDFLKWNQNLFSCVFMYIYECVLKLFVKWPLEAVRFTCSWNFSLFFFSSSVRSFFYNLLANRSSEFIALISFFLWMFFFFFESLLGIHLHPVVCVLLLTLIKTI